MLVNHSSIDSHNIEELKNTHGRSGLVAVGEISAPTFLIMINIPIMKII